MGAAQTDDDEEITAINVTPLVDITLVLLIIFMVTTSVIANQEGIGINKPEASTGQKIEGSHIMLECRSDGSIMVGGEPKTTDTEIMEAITDRLVENRELQGIVQCDEEVQVGTMVHLIDLLREAGVKKYAIATKKPSKAPAGS